MTATPKRKGARSTKDIPPDILAQLSRGELETANLVEWLAVDQRLLLENVLSEAGKTNYLSPILARIEQLPKQTVNTINEAIGTGLLEQATAHNDNELLPLLATHTADLVRCWATYTIGKNPELGLPILEPLKSDPVKYVRDSVGNWLNDASKTRPDFVRELCKQWQHESDTKETRYIVKKALRTVGAE